jgi:hypothetical protein
MRTRFQVMEPMEVEPAVYYNGQVSDESEHWLDNQKPIALPSPWR